MKLKLSECSSCGAPIIWAKTSPIKWLPVDAEPNSQGNIVLREEHEEVLAKVIGKTELWRYSVKNPDAVFRMSHFATCPNSNGHRKTA